VGTALNVAYTGALRRSFDGHTDPRRYLAPARDAMAGIVVGYLTSLC
jgi:fructose-bisphosphate aldolase class II